MNTKQILSLLDLVAVLLESLPQLYTSIMDIMKRTGQLSDTEWENLKARLESVMAQPYWQPEGTKPVTPKSSKKRG